MKTLSFLITLTLIAATSSLNAQQADVLDGKRYAIKAWDITNTDLKTPDLLIFRKGMVDAPVCHEYGFFPSTYEVYEDKGKTYFEFTSESPYEGEVAFSGIYLGDRIEGTYTWRKSGREDLNYEFEGIIQDTSKKPN